MNYNKIYVSKSLGSDLNPGTMAAPFENLDAALQQAAVSDTRSIIYLMAGEYSSKLLNQPIWNKYTPNIIGVDYIYHTDPISLLEFETDQAYTFDGYLNWNANDWESYDLIWWDGPSNYKRFQGKSILQNTEDTIYLGNDFNNGNFEKPVMGDRFRIVEPAAIINIIESEDDAPGIFGEGLITNYYCGHASGFLHYRNPAGSMRFENITFRTDISDKNTTIAFNGSAQMFGVHFVSTTDNDFVIQFTNGEYQIGADSNIDYNVTIPINEQGSLLGWGANFRNINYPNRRPRANIIRAAVRTACCFSGLGELHVEQGFLSLASGSFKRTRAFGYPHGVIGTYDNSHTVLDPSGHIFCNSETSNEPDLNTRYSSFCEGLAVAKFHHQGNNSFAVADHNSEINIYGGGNNILNEGSNMNISAVRRSFINLQGGDFSNLGTAKAGTSPELVRPAGPWANKESIIQQADSTTAETLKNTLPGDFSSIQRSS